MTLSLSCRCPMGLIAIMAVVSCASHVAADTQSVQSGNWSDPATWSTGQLPDASDAVTISAGNTIVYDLSFGRVAGITVEDGATLAFHPDMDATLETDANVLVRGRLEMRPQAPNNSGWQDSVDDWRPYFVHTIRFVDVGETAMQEGGRFGCTDVPPATDVGLWVLCDGVLDLEGAQKTGWTRLADGAESGDTTITLEAVPTGWRTGDEISIAPTEPPGHDSATREKWDGSWSHFDVRTIKFISGNTVRLDEPLAYDHPEVNSKWTAEVMNLSRNVRIEGTGSNALPEASNRSHVFIQSSVPQTIKHAEFKLLGVFRKLGRYALHFHMMRDGSRGSLVEGVVLRNSGAHAMVPHASHGITFRDTVVWDTFDHAFWWDPGEDHMTEDLLLDRVIIAQVKGDPLDRDFGHTRLSGFFIGEGTNFTNVIRNSVAVGVWGFNDSAGFSWSSEANASAVGNVWIFEDNVAHNNKGAGIFVWQNNNSDREEIHRIERYVAYHNGGGGHSDGGFGITHGAYVNAYQYDGMEFYGNEKASIHSKAAAFGQKESLHREDGYVSTFENFVTNERIRIGGHASGEIDPPVLFRNCVGITEAYGSLGSKPEYVDFVNCGLEPHQFTIENIASNDQIRVQRADCTAFQVAGSGSHSIPPFYPCDETAPDIEPPSAPSGLTAIASSTQVDLSWMASTDNVGVDHYRIYRDGASLAEVDGTSHADTGLQPETTYSYEVSAVDAGGNEGELSPSVHVTTDPDDPGDPEDPGDPGDSGDPGDGCTDCVVRLTLVDADTDQDVGELTDGTIISLSAWNIRADTDPSLIDSVRFQVDGVNYRNESAAPYALCGDRRGDYNDCGWTPGKKTITAIPFIDGVRDEPLTVVVEVQ